MFRPLYVAIAACTLEAAAASTSEPVLRHLSRGFRCVDAGLRTHAYTTRCTVAA